MSTGMLVTKHRGTLTRSPQWWKHLRDWKRVFWKRDRQALTREDFNEMLDYIYKTGADPEWLLGRCSCGAPFEYSLGRMVYGHLPQHCPEKK